METVSRHMPVITLKRLKKNSRETRLYHCFIFTVLSSITYVSIHQSLWEKWKQLNRCNESYRNLLLYNSSCRYFFFYTRDIGRSYVHGRTKSTLGPIIDNLCPMDLNGVMPWSYPKYPKYFCPFRPPLTCIIDMQLIHDALIAPSEDHNQLFDCHSSVSMSGPRHRAWPPNHTFPAGLQKPCSGPTTCWGAPTRDNRRGHRKHLLTLSKYPF